MGSVSRLHTPGCFGNSPLAPAHNAPVAPVQPAAEAPLGTLGGEPESTSCLALGLPFACSACSAPACSFHWGSALQPAYNSALVLRGTLEFRNRDSLAWLPHTPSCRMSNTGFHNLSCRWCYILACRRCCTPACIQSCRCPRIEFHTWSCTQSCTLSHTLLYTKWSTGFCSGSHTRAGTLCLWLECIPSVAHIDILALTGPHLRHRLQKG